MRSYSAPELAQLQARGGYQARILIWIEPRDPATGNRAGLGFWTGEDDRSFTIGSAQRTYVGGGALLGVDPVIMPAGLTVRMQRIYLSPLAAGVALLLRGHDAWRAPAEIHRVLFNPASGNIIADPHQVWRGVVDAAPIQTPAIGGEARVELTLSSRAEALTHGLTATRSDAVQSQRSGDRFYRFKDVTGAVKVSWGEK